MPSHAELIDNGNGLIYDDVLDITWAQNRNPAILSWEDANTYASELTLGGATDWRLPYISVNIGDGFTDGRAPYDCGGGTEEGCRDNELGYMFYQYLGGTSGEAIPPNGDPDVLNLFPNTLTIADRYWSATQDRTNPDDRAWSFDFNGGSNLSTPKTSAYFAWAVHDGNVGVPVAQILAASLPSSRSVQVGSLASAFATVTNTSNVAATRCSLAAGTSVAADFAYQTTDAANVPNGTPNTPADIAAGGSQNFIFGFLPSAPINPTEVVLNYDCSNTDPAPSTAGLNTLLLSASGTPVPDIVALAATPTADGIVDLPGTNGSNAFAVSTVNVGSTDTITASPVPSSVALPLVMSICETNPGTGVCLSGPAGSATSSVNANATPTYSVFVTGTGTVPFDPANNRINVEFRDGSGAVRGSTSVAVRTQ
jgi:hypothetical protein